MFLSPVPDSLCSSDWPEERRSLRRKDPPGNEQETLVAKCGQRSFPSEAALEPECPLPSKLLGSSFLLIPNKHNNTSSSAKNSEYLLFSLYLKYLPPIGAFFQVGSAQWCWLMNFSSQSITREVQMLRFYSNLTE